MADIQYSIHPLHCWGPWLLHWSQLLHWRSYCISAASCGSLRRLANGLAIIMYQIYIHTPSPQSREQQANSLDRYYLHIFLLSQLFLQAASGLWQFGARTSPSSEPLFPSPVWDGQLRESLRLGKGAHSWVAGICQLWGQYSIQGLTGHSGSPQVSQAPTFHLTEAVG